MRLFIAVELNTELRRRLSLLQENLRTSQADVKWVEEKNLHLTLHFLGEVEEGLIPRLHKSMEEAGRVTGPFIISLAGTGVFPGPARPRVVWAGVVQGMEPLTRLQRCLGQYLAEIGVTPDCKSFHPHITLGRVRSPLNAGRLTAQLQVHTNVSWGSQRVEGLALFESRLGRGGPQYHRLAWTPLAPQAGEP